MSDESLDPMGGPLRHLRRAAPPWSSQARTVCGRPLDDVAAWLPFEEAKALFGKVGHVRAQFLFCQTCLSMHGYRQETPTRWEEEPDKVVADWAGRSNWRHTADGEQTRAELRALAFLVDAHREEYDAAVAALLNDDLAARRRAPRRRA